MAGLDGTTRTANRDGEEHFSIVLTYDESLFVIELYGELDLAAAAAVQGAIARAEETSAVTILIDLSGLHFIDSSGIQALIAENKRSRRRQRPDFASCAAAARSPPRSNCAGSSIAFRSSTESTANFMRTG